MTGALKVRNYERQDGSKGTSVEMNVDEIGPSLRFATAKVTRVNRSGGGGGGGFGGGGTKVAATKVAATKVAASAEETPAAATMAATKAAATTHGRRSPHRVDLARGAATPVRPKSPPSNHSRQTGLIGRT